jgi:hypothetical protein
VSGVTDLSLTDQGKTPNVSRQFVKPP